MEESTAVISIILGLAMIVAVSVTAYNLFPPEQESITCSCGASINEYHIYPDQGMVFTVAHAKCINEK